MGSDELKRKAAKLREFGMSPFCAIEDNYLIVAVCDGLDSLTAQLAEARESERAAVVAWLRDDAAKTADDLRRLHAKKKLTPMMTEGWEAVIRTKGGVAFAIEAGEHLT